MAGRILLLSLIVLTLPAKDIATDFEPDGSFSQYKTFSFVKGIDMGHTGVLDNPSVRDRLKNFISGVLEIRRLREVPRDESYDLAVRYWVARRDRQETETVITPSTDIIYWGGYPPYWYGPWSAFYEEYVVRNYVEGTLIVDLIDAKTKQLIWRTYLRQKIEDRAKAYEQAKKNLNRSFAGFPPSANDCDKMRKERARLSAKSQ